MEITSENAHQLERLHGCRAEAFEYMRFGGILRLRLEDRDGENWIMSFCECRAIAFRPGGFVLQIKFRNEKEGSQGASDPGSGFDVIFRHCFLLHEDEFLSGGGLA